MRSWLFIPGDSERKLAKLDALEADAVILDLEDAVLPEAKTVARKRVREALDARPTPRAAPVWVRINPLDGPLALADLAAVIGGRPDGIMLPKFRTVADLQRLDAALAALEAREGLAENSIPMVAVGTETARSLFELGTLDAAGPRLQGLTWGAEDLAVDLGAARNRDSKGEWLPTYQLARSLVLAGAAAAGIQAIDTVYTDFRDREGLRESCRRARADGFAGKLAIHPDQVSVINEAFTPGDDEVEWARAVIAVFAEGSGDGALSLHGKLLDAPHLKQAQRILAQAAQSAR
ncbi:MAG: CoA ester lyase [Gammaproteobacteria bacterium]|nr:CoA ester lyase [Gammaproteobacteria bacterium]